MPNEQKLLRVLDTVAIDDLAVFAETNSMNLKALVTQIASGLDLATANASPKMFNLKARFGKGLVIKLIYAVLKSFCDSIKASRTMDSVDMLECAELLEEKYSHDSVKDIILALKNAKLKGVKFYNAVDVSVIMAICEEYFLSKAVWLEGRHSKHSDSGRTEQALVSISFEKALEAKKKEQEDKINRERQARADENERMRLEILKSQI